jgi:hypothetical protein
MDAGEVNMKGRISMTSVDGLTAKMVKGSLLVIRASY